MSLKDILGKGPLTLRKLQEFQQAYDTRFVSDTFTGFEKVRHTYAHMGKLFGRLAEYVQMTEDGHSPSPEDIKTKVIPDLLVYASWLASVFDVTLEDAYIERSWDNINRLHGKKDGAIDELNDLDQHRCYRARKNSRYKYSSRAKTNRAF